MPQPHYYGYLLCNELRTVLYTGVTNDLEQRIMEHYTHQGQHTAFTAKYRVYYLLYYEAYHYINDAIAREKEIKGWRREKKLALIATTNPELDFLNAELFGTWPPQELTQRL